MVKNDAANGYPVDAPLSVGLRGSQANLYRLSDGRFQIVKDGPLLRLMTGGDYILADATLVDTFRSAGVEGVQFEARIIYDPTTQVETRGYHELRIANKIDPDTIRSVDATGMRVWCFNRGDLFVSPALGAILEARFPELEFSSGLEFG